MKESTGSTSRMIFGNTGITYSNGVPMNYSEDGTTDANLKSYGVSFLAASTAAGTMKKYTLDAPTKGIQKLLVLNTTVAPMGSSDATIVSAGSGNEIFGYGTTAVNNPYRSVVFQSPITCATLVGLSTSQWLLTNFRTASTLAAYAALGLSTSYSSGPVST